MSDLSNQEAFLLNRIKELEEKFEQRNKDKIQYLTFAQKLVEFENKKVCCEQDNGCQRLKVMMERIEKLEIEISELKEYYNIEKNVANKTDFDWKVGIIDRIINSEEVLRELNNAFNKLVDKLTPEEYSEEQDWYADLYESVNIEKLDGEKSVIQNRRVGKASRPSAEPTRAVEKQSLTDSRPSEPIFNEEEIWPEKEECEHNRPFWECEICGNIRYKKEPTDDFIKVESKPYWLIPKDIDDFFRYYPSDGVRIKYDRLLGSLPEKADLERIFKKLRVFIWYGENKELDELEKKYLEDADES